MLSSTILVPQLGQFFGILFITEILA